LAYNKKLLLYAKMLCGNNDSAEEYMLEYVTVNLVEIQMAFWRIWTRR